MHQRNRCCAFTGHRPDGLPPSAEGERLKARLFTLIPSLVAQGYTSFLCGGALGWDTWAAEAVLRARDEGHAVRLVLLLPCPEQTNRWSPANARRYEAILARADEVHYTSKHWHSGCMHVRNRALVDGASLCVAYCARPQGGSAYTVAYARQKGVTVYNLAAPVQANLV